MGITFDKENENLDSIIKSGSVEIDGKNGTFYCLSIIGQIEGHYVLDQNQKATKYDHILPLLVALEEEEKIDGIIIIINTLGGGTCHSRAYSELKKAHSFNRSRWWTFDRRSSCGERKALLYRTECNYDHSPCTYKWNCARCASGI